MLWEFVVPVHSQAGEYIGRDGSPPPLPPLVVLPLLPRRKPRPRRGGMERGDRKAGEDAVEDVEQWKSRWEGVGGGVGCEGGGALCRC